MPFDYKHEFRLLNRLMAAQSMLHVFPTITQMIEFSKGALKSLACFNSCSFCLYDFESPIGDFSEESKNLIILMHSKKGIKNNRKIELPSSEYVNTFPLKTAFNIFGYAVFSIKDKVSYELFKPAVSNFINIISIHIENIIQNEQIKAHQLQLEDLVVMRTAELNSEIISRINTQELLEKSERKFRKIYESLPNGIELYDFNGNMLELNQACIDIFGLQDPSAVKSFNLFADPNLSEEMKNDIKNGKIIHREIIFDFDQVHSLNLYETNKHGIIYLDLTITTIDNFASKTEVRYLVHVRDITERIEHEKEMQKKNEELASINAEKDKFFSIVAHDLRSPFQGFVGLTDMMAEDISSFTQEEIEDICKRVNKSAINLYKLLDDLLEWAHLKKGTYDFDPQLISLHEISEEAFASAYQQALQKEIQLINYIPKSLNVFIDGKMIRSVFNNLITNAVKFTKSGGKVSLNVEIENDFIKIAISDTGVGMGKDTLNNLFQIDKKVGTIGTDGEKSSGLGLLLCKEFIDLHKGKIWAESKEGSGSTFYFTLSKLES